MVEMLTRPDGRVDMVVDGYVECTMFPDNLDGPHWSDYVHVWAPEWDDERDDD